MTTPQTDVANGERLRITSADGEAWEKYPVQMEVSGYHHNVAGQFLALKPGIYAAGEGKVHFRDFRYRALDY